jgi:hypothetical protein
LLSVLYQRFASAPAACAASAVTPLADTRRAGLLVLPSGPQLEAETIGPEAR